MKIATAHAFFFNTFGSILMSANTTLTVYYHDLIRLFSNITDLFFRFNWFLGKFDESFSLKL